MFNYCISGALRDDPLCQKYLNQFYNEGMLPEERLRVLFDSAVSTDKRNIISAAFRCFLAQDAQNNTNATYYLGLCYLRGIGTDKDLAKAKECFEKGAHQNHSPCQELLDDFFLLFPTERIPQMQSYLEAAKRHILKGMVLYSWTRLIQSNWSTDNKEAVDWLLRAIHLEVPQKAPDADHSAAYKGIAYYLLGNCYRDGIGLPVNPDLAVYYYQHAAELHFSAAFFELGNCYSLGYGVPFDPIRAAQLYQRAVDLDFPIAFFSLGYCYQFGWGVQIDPMCGSNLHRKATQLESKGNPLAEYGRCYRFRLGSLTKNKNQNIQFNLINY